MKLDFTPREGFALYGLLTEATTDIILKIDRKGYIQHASPGIARLGFSRTEVLIWPHLSELVHPSFAGAMQRHLDRLFSARPRERAIEVAAVTRERDVAWFEMQAQPLADSGGEIYGAVCVLRNIEERKALEDSLFAAAMTDPLTGLTNRQAFVMMLGYLVDERSPGCLALVDIDHFKAINLHYGQHVGDEVLVVFAELLRTMLRASDIISRVGSESFGVLLPGTGLEEAETVCRRIGAVLADARHGIGSARLAITASAGMTRIDGSVDETIRRAELAAFFARARGPNTLEVNDGGDFPWSQLAKPPERRATAA